MAPGWVSFAPSIARDVQLLMLRKDNFEQDMHTLSSSDAYSALRTPAASIACSSSWLCAMTSWPYVRSRRPSLAACSKLGQTRTAHLLRQQLGTDFLAGLQARVLLAQLLTRQCIPPPSLHKGTCLGSGDCGGLSHCTCPCRLKPFASSCLLDSRLLPVKC